MSKFNPLQNHSACSLPNGSLFFPFGNKKKKYMKIPLSNRLAGTHNEW